MELCAISENLDIKKNSPLRTKYPALFTSASALRGQRDILTHRYGLPSDSIDWGLVWKTLDNKLESDLLVELEDVINKESSGDSEEE
jgi:uncharacterized protein with HEPN domain